MAWSNIDMVWLSMMLFFLVPVIHAAPLSELGSDNLGYYPVSDKTGCYYNFQHYDEGDRIFTNEPCLNCTCHNKMLMCYLRVCPFVKAYGDNCRVEKRADLCCPIITCPEVPVPLIPSNETQVSDNKALGRPENYGCTIDGLFYSDGVRIPGDPNKPCELCYCIKNKTACVMQECTLKIQGCTPVYHKDICCPIRYNCDRPGLEGPTDSEGGLVFTTTTTTTTTTTAAPTTTEAASSCIYNDQIYQDGEKLLKSNKDKPCETCYCMKGHIVCAVQECAPTPLEKINCTAVPPAEGECCPSVYQCDNISGELSTTEQYGESTLGLKDISGTTIAPNVPTKASEDSESESSSVETSSQEDGSVEKTTSPVETTNPTTEGTPLGQETSSEEVGITTSAHDGEKLPTLPSESQITTVKSISDENPETDENYETSSELVKPIENHDDDASITTKPSIIQPSSENYPEGPSADGSDDIEDESNGYSTTKKDIEVVHSETTPVQIGEEPSSTEYVQKNEDTITTEKYQTSKSSSDTYTHSSEESLSEVTTQKLKEKDFTDSTTHQSVSQDISQSATETTKESATSAHDEDLQTDSNPVTEKTAEGISESPQTPVHVPDLEKESDKPSYEPTSSTTEEVLSENEGGYSTQKSEFATGPSADTEQDSEKSTESTENKIGENIESGSATETLPVKEEDEQETTMEVESDSATESVTEGSVYTEKEHEPTSKSSTEIPTTSDNSVNKQTTISGTSALYSEATSTHGYPLVTEEDSISSTSKNVEVETTAAPVQIVDRLPDITTDKAKTDEATEYVTELHTTVTLEQTDDSSPEVTSLSHTTTTEKKTDIVTESSHSIENEKTESNEESASTEASNEEEKITKSQEGPISSSPTEKVPDSPENTERNDGSEKENQPTSTISSETSESSVTPGTKDSSSDSSSTEVNVGTEETKKQSNEDQSEEDFETYEASTTPEAIHTDVNLPETDDIHDSDEQTGKQSGIRTSTTSPGEVDVNTDEASLITESNETEKPNSSSTSNEYLPQVTTGSTDERLVPGEGSCLVDGITYENNAYIEPINQCQVSCKCVNSIVKCESVSCDPPPSDSENCMAVYTGPDSCCPIYNCATPGGDQPMESDSQKKEHDHQYPSTVSDITTTETNYVNIESEKSTESSNTVNKEKEITTSATLDETSTSKSVESDTSEESVERLTTVSTKEFEGSSTSVKSDENNPTESDKEPTDSQGHADEVDKESDIETTESTTLPNSDSSEEVTVYLGGSPTTESSDFIEASSTSSGQEILEDGASDTKKPEVQEEVSEENEISHGTIEPIDKTNESTESDESSSPKPSEDKEPDEGVSDENEITRSTIKPNEDNTESSKSDETTPSISEDQKSHDTEGVTEDHKIPQETVAPSETGPSEVSTTSKPLENEAFGTHRSEEDNASSTQGSVTEKEKVEILPSTTPGSEIESTTLIDVKSSSSEESSEDASKSTEKSPDITIGEEATVPDGNEPFTSKPSEGYSSTENAGEINAAEITTQKAAQTTTNNIVSETVGPTEKSYTEEEKPYTSPTIGDENKETVQLTTQKVDEPYTSKPSIDENEVRPSPTTEIDDKQDGVIFDGNNDDFDEYPNVESTSPKQQTVRPQTMESSSTASSSAEPAIVTEKLEPEKESTNDKEESDETEPEHVTIPDDSKPEMPENDNLVTETPSVSPNFDGSHKITTEKNEVITQNIDASGDASPDEEDEDEVTKVTQKPELVIEASSHSHELDSGLEKTTDGVPKEVTTETLVITEKQEDGKLEASTESDQTTTQNKGQSEVSTESTKSEEKDVVTTSSEVYKPSTSSEDDIVKHTTISSESSTEVHVDYENKQTSVKPVEVDDEKTEKEPIGSEENITPSSTETISEVTQEATGDESSEKELLEHSTQVSGATSSDSITESSKQPELEESESPDSKEKPTITAQYPDVTVASSTESDHHPTEGLLEETSSSAISGNDEESSKSTEIPNEVVSESIDTSKKEDENVESVSENEELGTTQTSKDSSEASDQVTIEPIHKATYQSLGETASTESSSSITLEKEKPAEETTPEDQQNEKATSEMPSVTAESNEEDETEKIILDNITTDANKNQFIDESIKDITTEKSDKITESDPAVKEQTTVKILELSPTEAATTESVSGEHSNAKPGVVVETTESDESVEKEQTTKASEDNSEITTQNSPEVSDSNDSEDEEAGGKSGSNKPPHSTQKPTEIPFVEENDKVSTPQTVPESTELPKNDPSEGLDTQEKYSTETPKSESTDVSHLEDTSEKTGEESDQTTESLQKEQFSTQSSSSESTESGNQGSSVTSAISEEHSEITTPKQVEPSETASITETNSQEESKLDVTTLSTEGIEMSSTKKPIGSSTDPVDLLTTTSNPSEIPTIKEKTTENLITSGITMTAVPSVETESSGLKGSTAAPESEITSVSSEKERVTTIPPSIAEEDNGSLTTLVQKEIVTSPKSVPMSEETTVEITSESITKSEKDAAAQTTEREIIVSETSTEFLKESSTSKAGESDESVKPITDINTNDATPSSSTMVSIDLTTEKDIEKEINTEKSQEETNAGSVDDTSIVTEKSGNELTLSTSSAPVDKEIGHTIDEGTSEDSDKAVSMNLPELEATTTYEKQDTVVTKENILTTTEKTISEEPFIIDEKDKYPTEEKDKINESTTEFVKKTSDNEITTSRYVPERETYRPSTLSHFIPTVTSTTTAEPEKLPSLPDYSEPDYEENGDEFGPGTCRYGGKVYVSAQQIPRDDPCDFCFCFRSDIICLQQSCPPPIRNCHQEPIRGFCCPRYECPVNMALSLNVTTTTTTTTTTLPPHFLSHAYKGKAVKSGCLIKGQSYQVGDPIPSASGPCLQCKCGGHGQMECNPVVCSPSPMLEQMLTVAAKSKRRR